MSNAGSFSSGSFGVTKNQVPAMSFSSEPINFNSLNAVSSASSYDSGRVISPFNFSGSAFSGASTTTPSFESFSSTVSGSGITTIPCGLSSIPEFSSTPTISFGSSVSSTPLTFSAFSSSGSPFSSAQVTVPAFTSSNPAMSSTVTATTITIPTLFSFDSTKISSTATMATPILAPLVSPFEQFSVKTTTIPSFCTSGMVFSSTTDTIPAIPSWGSVSSRVGTRPSAIRRFRIASLTSTSTSDSTPISAFQCSVLATEAQASTPTSLEPQPLSPIEKPVKDPTFPNAKEQARIDSQSIQQTSEIHTSQVREYLNRKPDEEKVTYKETKSAAPVVAQTKISFSQTAANAETVPLIPAEIKREEEEETNLATKSFGTSAQPNSRILKGIPQNPHFRLLQSYSKNALKNLILGWDQTFEDTVDQIHSLRVNGFWTSVDELWKTLEELESMGYNVSPLRNRLNKLSEFMMKRKASEFEILELRKNAEYHTEEKKRLEGEILKLQVQAEKEKVMIKELADQVAKMEENLPVGDGVFATLAMAPL
ncbi:hypothetical protein HHK36_018548 [Tetracentron sinense]|uniref:Uncharacterized protein n=1 Tax=Tetracentron sinense TaxID=13715 RepID=A0A835DAX8_TETSI|nr:hypothetical protein HHK36_018548 [Tetracentron sinense]